MEGKLIHNSAMEVGRNVPATVKKSLIDSLHWLHIGAHTSFPQFLCGNNIENVPARKFPFSESVHVKCRFKMNTRYI